MNDYDVIVIGGEYGALTEGGSCAVCRTAV